LTDEHITLKSGGRVVWGAGECDYTPRVTDWSGEQIGDERTPKA